MEILFVICFIFFFGVLFGHIAKKFGFPEVTGYLVSGILIGPSVLTILNLKMVDNMGIFSTIALAFISFMIGAEFKLKHVKKLGIKPFTIAIFCSIFTMFFVTLCLMAFKVEFSVALILGAIASSTAPAAIMMIVKEYKARGELTNNMLSVIAIDDIISIFIFGFTLVIAQYSQITSLSAILEPFKEIIISLIIGILMGLLLGTTTKIFKTHLNATCLIIANIFAIILLCNIASISPQIGRAHV